MFQPAPLSIDPNEVLRYLGGGHAVPPEALLDEIDRCGRQLLNAVTPKVTWHAFPLSDFSLEGTRVHLSGQDIRRHLDGLHPLRPPGRHPGTGGGTAHPPGAGAGSESSGDFGRLCQRRD